MPAIVGNANQNYSGLHLGTGPDGPIAIFFGSPNPNSLVDTTTQTSDGMAIVSGTDRITAPRSGVGSLFIQTGTGTHWIKTTAGVWTALTVP